MPVKADPVDYIQNMGGVDAESSYDILKNKCAWGNLNDPHVYVDPESLNNSVRPKTNFMRVAQSFMARKKFKEAIEMLDLYIKYFPDSKVPFDMYMLPYAEIYYQAGATDKANKLITRVSEIYSQNLDYYRSFPPSFTQYFEQDVQTSLGVLKRLSMVASQYKQPELAGRVDTIFNQKLKYFNP
jgi:tetratricopeptide (TPR) repeat protein